MAERNKVASAVGMVGLAACKIKMRAHARSAAAILWSDAVASSKIFEEAFAKDPDLRDGMLSLHVHGNDGIARNAHLLTLHSLDCARECILANIG